MKKLFTLLLLATAIFSNKTNAQNTTPCNPAFTAQAVTNFTYKFTPAIVTDSPLVQHSWNFGDGGYSNNIVPVYTYANPGTYTVMHYISRISPNGVSVCFDSAYKVINIYLPCNIQANFISAPDSANPFKIHFTNQTVNFNPSDSIRWTFGDGTVSYDVNPVHLYANAGTYNVCLRIKRNGIVPGAAPCVSELCKTITIVPATACNLVVNYSWHADSTQTNKIYFTNLSTPLATNDSIRWTFGDGTSSNHVSPDHIYANAGTYTVCLRIIKREANGALTNCIKDTCKTVVVPEPCNLIAGFIVHKDSASAAPNTYYFQNTSTPLAATDSIRWTFGDGTSSNAVNPVHTYAQAGTYTVCLRVIKRTSAGVLSTCVKETCTTVVVQEPCNLTASFIIHKDSLATSPYTYYFQNTSTPLAATDSIRWSFGDGALSNAVNPVHTYAQAGTYSVCLVVIKRNAAGTLSTCIKETCTTLVVQQACNIQPNYSWMKDSINNKKIYFTNLTAGANTNITFIWSFGDGTTATSYNAVHEYAQPGRYYVCLRASYGNCVTYRCDSITVSAPVPPCTQLSNYTYLKAASNNQQYSFKPDYIGTDIQYTWTFGDGTGSHDPVVTHNFTASAVYNVCLTAFRNANCASTTCKTISVLPQINCDSVHVSFSDIRDSLFPNKITFIASSNQLILDQLWTITRTTATGGQVIIHQNNPTYIFADTGYYVVCLKATTVGGCIKNYCKTFHITQVGSNACELQAYPNPATNSVNVNVLLSQPETIYAYLYNSLNVLLLTKTQAGVAGNNIVTINTANLTAGLYTIKFVYGNHVCYARFQKL